MPKPWLQEKTIKISFNKCLISATKKTEITCKIHIFHFTSCLPQSSFGLDHSEELVIVSHKHTLSYYLNCSLP